MNNQKQIILFDGVCNFCNFWVNYVIKRDMNDVFRIASLQSEKGIELTSRFNFNSSNLDTFILIIDNEIHIKSTALLMICKQLFGPVKIFFLLILVPKFIRDFVYDIIAKNRYKIFGRRNNCRVPAEKDKKKFLT